MYGVYMSTRRASEVSRRPLTRQRIADQGVALADQVGLDQTTMRRLADDLGVTPMALYKHVEGREDLIDAMVDAVIAPLAESPTEAADWLNAVRSRILAARALVVTHPWMVEAIESRTRATWPTLAYMDHLMGMMFEGGLSADLVHHAMHALSTRMWGFTRDVLPTPQVSDDPDERRTQMEAYASGLPNIVRMATTAPGAGHDCDADAEFLFALDALLEAVDQKHRDGWTSGR